MKKLKIGESWSTRSLPDDCLAEILSTLPAKSLLRFRTVSKPWLALIDDPDFARSHLARFNNNRLESHLFVGKSSQINNELECVVKCSETLKNTTTLLLSNSMAWFTVLSSVNGLFMLIRQEEYFYRHLELTIMVWNPSIRKTLTLPPCPGIPEGCLNVDIGLGFDPLSQKYKHVRVVATRTEANFVAIYTLGTNSWKTIECRGEWIQTSSLYLMETTLCIKGILYTLSRNHSKFLLFDLNNEVFATLGLPVEDNGYLRLQYQALTMGDGESALAVVSLSEPNGYVWVLESSGGADNKSSSWTQLYTFPILSYPTCPIIPGCYSVPWNSEFLYIKKNGEMLLNIWKHVISYDLETKRENILQETMPQLHEKKIWPYMENLYRFN